ncbi:hypothetical protein NIES4103_02230 [Nostoc sp. NIES-4103]|nr:hypothetical protein NIES4103_02230 [Nostoc sp. NIES-4103]
MTQTPEQNNAVAVRFFEAAWNEGNFAVLEELLAPNSVDHSTVTGKTETGSASFKQIVSLFRSAIPDIHLTIEDEIYAKDKVVHRWFLSGTHQKELFGVPATGKTLKFSGTTTVRVAEGKIAERWTNIDELGLLRQLGVVPSPNEQN